MSEIEKFERDGKVAVLVSPGYGAGWSTWNRQYGAAAVFSVRIVRAILGDSDETPWDAAKREFPDGYHRGISDLEIEWVTKGERFEIDEYDGNETLRIFGPDDGFVA